MHTTLLDAETLAHRTFNVKNFMVIVNVSLMNIAPLDILFIGRIHHEFVVLGNHGPGSLYCAERVALNTGHLK